jgi:hypothetical protein
MVRPFLLIAVLATSLPLVAQDAPVTDTVTPNAPATTKAVKPAMPTGRITGTVLCADTHRPARGAMLMIAPVNPSEVSNSGSTGGGMARVGMDGTYTVEHLAPGEYAVMAALPGYLSPIDDMISSLIEDHSPAAQREALSGHGTVTITGGEAETYDISLERGGAVSGRVLYSDGSPATQIIIDVEDINTKKLTGEKQRESQMASGMFRTMFTHQSQSTDDQGRFRIASVKPGTYRVAAISSFSSTIDSQDNEMNGVAILIGRLADPGALRVYSGDTLHAKAAKTYELRSGDEVSGIDITIPLNAYHLVKGTLAAIDGRPINKATLTLTDTSDDTVSFETSVSEDGTFIFPAVAAGTYTLDANEGRIIGRVPGSNPDIPLRYAPTKAIAAFADGTTSVIVKDSDIPDVALTLTEVPLPPAPTLPANLDPDN